MAKDKEESDDTSKEKEGIGLVSVTGEIGYGMRMPDGEVIQMTNTDVGTSQVLAHIVKELSELKRNIG